MKTVKPKPSKTKKNSSSSSSRLSRIKFVNKETTTTLSSSSSSSSSSSDITQSDLSELRKPIDISVSSLIQVTKLLEIGGDEVKTILAYECDVIYECRVCRSLYRSLANFVSHKRIYCRDKFDVATICRKTNYETIIPEEIESEIKEVEEFKEDDNNRILRSQVVRNNSKKDLTSVLDMLQRKRKEDLEDLNFVKPATKVKKFTAVGRRAKLKEKARVEKIVQEPVLLEAIDGSKSAVYQTAVVRVTDLMKTQMTELQNMIGRKTAIVNPDGKTVDVVVENQLEKSDSPLQIYGSGNDDEEEDTECVRNLVCTVCNARFATRKTLTYHMKSLHVSYRTCYPCPCCNSIFANTWSVYRHLYKVHRKTNEQVRRLRTQIQEKAFRKETTGAEDIEKENEIIKSSLSTGSGGSKKETTNNDTRESLENFELDIELQRCGGCGRRFDRKAALISHSHTCQKRMATSTNVTRSSNRRKRLTKLSSKSLNNKLIDKDDKLKVIESSDVQLINVDNKIVNESSTKKTDTEDLSSSSSSSSPPLPSSSSQLSSSIDGISDIIADKIPDLITTNNESSIRVENVSRITNDDWERIGNNFDKSPTTTTTTTTTVDDKSPQSSSEKIYPIENDTNDDDDEKLSTSKYIQPQSDAPEIIFTSIDKSRTVAISYGAKKRRVSVLNESKDKDTSISRVTETENSLVSSKSVNKSDSSNAAAGHVAIMENRLAAIANLRKLQCLPCRQKFTSMTNLRRHMAIHIGWNRYRCKLCDFKCFVKCDCVAHCNKIHDAKNNRAVIADMVMQIPPDENALAQDYHFMNVSSNSSESSPEPEVIEVATTKLDELAEISTQLLNGSQSPINKPVEPELEPEISKSGKTTEDDERSSSKNEEDDDEKSTTPEKKLTSVDSSDDLTTRNQSQSKLDTDPDLRKMVMEVIFGTTETNVHQSETKNRKINGAVKEVATCCNDDNNTKKERNDIRPQRPMRNRVKPINEDFIYDLTELIRKESAIHRAALTTTSQKTLRKKQSNNQQQQQQSVVVDMVTNEFSDETRSDSVSTNDATTTVTQKLSSACKLPSLLSCNKKGTESVNNYTSKFSLRKAEIKLHPATSNGLTSSLSNSIGSTKISVSGNK